MADAVRESGLLLSRPSAPSRSAAESSRHAQKAAAAAGIWLNGEVIGCQCPECKHPVAIRAWLMMGDCLHCGTSFELTEEQERIVRQLMEQDVAPEAPAVPVAKTVEVPAKRVAPVAKPQAAATRTVAPPPLPARSAAAAPVMMAEQAFSWGDIWRDLPAWLASLIIHMVLLILLALWVPTEERLSPRIVLSAVIGPRHQEGEPTEPDRVDEVEFADAGEPDLPDEPDPQKPPTPPPPPPAESLAAAEQDAQELAMLPTESAAQLPNLAQVMSALERPSRQRMFEGRDPRVRARVVNQEGGTTYTEAAVARGMRWIAAHQHGDGSWNLHNFHTTGDCNGQCGGHGHDADTAATGLALLPMLGAGQTHLQGRYTKQVASGLKFLLAKQKPDGDLRGNGAGRMYAHGIASIVLCESFALSGDEKLRDAATRAVNYIVQAQHSEGGWRYNPGEPGDTSVVGWQLMALRSGRMAGIEVPEEVFARADQFLNRVQSDTAGGVYAYQPGGPATATMTAEALLCRQYLGWPKDHRGMRMGSQYLVRNWLPNPEQPNIYYWYYGTQVMHHLGGRRWEQWNAAMRDTLVSMQETEGHAAGSWSPVGGAIGNHDTQVGGRLYMTSLAICTLEVYYRHLPIYRPIKMDEP
jgi:hypothetical protein